MKKDSSVYVTPSKNQMEDDRLSEQELSRISRLQLKLSPKSPQATGRAPGDDYVAHVAQKKNPKYNIAMAYAAGSSLEENKQKFNKILRVYGVEIILNMEFDFSEEEKIKQVQDDDRILRDIERLRDGDMDNWNRSTVLMLAATSGDKGMIDVILESLSNENELPMDQKCQYVQDLISREAVGNEDDFDLVEFELCKKNVYNGKVIKGTRKGKDDNDYVSTGIEFVDGNTALMTACYCGHLSVVEAMIEKRRAVIYDTCEFNNTCLHLAVENDHIDVVKYLIQCDETLTAELEQETAIRENDDVSKFSGHKKSATRMSSSKSTDIPVSDSSKMTDFSPKEENTLKDCLLNRKNYAHKTPLMLACQLGSFRVARWFLEEKASYFHLNEASIKWDLHENPVEDMNYVTYACKGTINHDRILELLLKYGAEVNIRVGETTPLCFAAKTGAINAARIILDSPQGRKDPITVNFRNSLGFTPLMRSAEAGQLEFSKYLIERGAAKWLYNPPFIIDPDEITEIREGNGNEKSLKDRKAMFIYNEDHYGKESTALSLALSNAHIDLATECFMTDVNDMGERVSMLDVSYEECHLNPKTITCFLSEKLLERKVMSSLTKYAPTYNFHYSLFMKIFKDYCEDSNKSLELFLNYAITSFFENFRGRKLREGMTDVDIIYKLVNFCAFLKIAMESHSLIRDKIEEYYDLIDTMIANCLNTESMGSEKNIIDVLCSFSKTGVNETYVNDMVNHAYAFIEGPIALSIQYKSHALFCSGEISMFIDNLFWHFLKCPADLDLDALFSSGNGSQLETKHRKYAQMDMIRSSGQRLKSGRKHLSTRSTANATTHWLNELYKPIKEYIKEALPDDNKRGRYPSRNIVRLQSKQIFIRYCPAVMFLLEGLSKSFCLFLCAYISAVADRNSSSDYIPSSDMVTVEYMLIGMIISLITYEIGELNENTTSILPTGESLKAYFDDRWNKLDAFSYFLLLGWMICRVSQVTQDSFDTKGELAHGFLSFSTIFLSFGLLRYLNIYESLGKLTLMLGAMMGDLSSFFIVFFVVLVGFSVALYSLLHDANFDDSSDPYFTDVWNTLVTMLSAALGNYDMTMFHTQDSPYYYLCFFIIFFYITVSALVLVNLVVARMTASHDTIDENSFEDWNFEKALTTEQFIMVEEKHPLNMLPAPLNLITALLMPIHWYHLNKAATMRQRQDESASKQSIDKGFKTKPISRKSRRPDAVSVCGTAADWILGTIASFILPFYEYFMAFRQVNIFRNFKKLDQNIEIKAQTQPGTINDHHSQIGINSPGRDSFSNIHGNSQLQVQHPVPHSSSREGTHFIPPAIVVLASFPFVYLLYVLVLIYHTYTHSSEIEILHTSDGAKYMIYYEKKLRTKNSSSFMSSIFRGSSVMVIDVMKAENLKKCVEDSTPVVEFEINGVVFRTGTPRLAGSNPEWYPKVSTSTVEASDGNNEDNKNGNYDSPSYLDNVRENGGRVLVPLRKVQLARGREGSTFKITVLDPFKKENNVPKVYGTCDIEVDVVHNWIAGTRFEGQIVLDKSEGNDTGTLHVNVSVEKNNYLIDLLDPAGVSKRREDDEKARAEKNQMHTEKSKENAGWKKNKKGGVTHAVSAFMGGELFLDGNETSGGMIDNAGENNDDVIKRILSSKGVRVPGEKLPEYFRAREIIEGVDLVFDEVDKDSIFGPIVRTADSIDKALDEIKVKLSDSDERASRMEGTLDIIGDMVEEFRSGYSRSHEEVSRTLQEDIAAKEDLSKTSADIQKSFLKMERNMVRGKEVSDLRSVIADVGDQLLGQFKSTDDRIDSFKSELHRGRKVSAEELAHQKAVDERMDKLSDAINMLREELMKIRRNL